MMREFYPGTQRYSGDRALSRALAEEAITQDDHDLIGQYIRERQATRHISDHRRNKIAGTLAGWRRFIPAPFSAATLPEIHQGIAALKVGQSHKGRPFKQNTIHDHIRILKPFLLWLIENGHSSLPTKKVKEITAPPVDYQTTEPDEILTVEEIRTLLAACLNPRDRAMISLLYESGCRIGELARICWRDIVFDEYGCKLYLHDGKSKKRRYSRLTMAAEYIAAWKADYRPGHPDPGTLVFQTFEGRPLDYIQARRIISRAHRRAGIEKKITPHLFRHSRITHMIGQNYQESIIKKSLWGNINTAMFAAYVNLAEQDIDNEFLHRAGITQKQETTPALQPTTCPNCHRTNAPTADYCTRCAEPLSDAARDREEKKRSTLIEDLERDPLYIALESRYQQFMEEARAEIARLKS